jgi:hypothetical protein
MRILFEALCLCPVLLNKKIPYLDDDLLDVHAATPNS